MLQKLPTFLKIAKDYKTTSCPEVAEKLVDRAKRGTGGTGRQDFAVNMKKLPLSHP